MQRKKLWKQGLSLGISLVMALLVGISPLPEGLFSLTANAAEKTFSLPKSELALSMNVIPKALSVDKSFMDKYVRDGDMNINSYFKVSSEGNSNKSVGNVLKSSDKLKHNKAGSGWNVHYKWTPSDAQAALLHDTSYNLVYEGNAISEYHTRTYSSGWNVYRHKNGWDRAEVGIEHSGWSIWNAKSTMKDSGKAQKVSWSCNNLNYRDYVGFYTKSLDCKCGESASSGNLFYMVDTSIPKITDTYICTDMNNPTGSKVDSGSGFAANSTVTSYLVFEFSEQVRFSDNKGKEIELNLDAYDRNTGVALDKGTIKAKLVSFVDNRMIFQYTVPSKINNKPTDIYITGVSSEQSELNGSFNLTLYKDNGDSANTGDQKSRCYITDIAGNSLNWGSSDTWAGYIYYDNVAPTMKNVTMNGSMITSASKNSTDGVSREAIFAGVGDWVDFKFIFSENIRINTSGQMAMVLNVKDASGNPITLNCSLQRGNEIQSERLTITEDLLDASAAGQSIYVERIQGINSITDSYGNTMVKGTYYTANLSSITMKPAQEIMVDVDAPVIETDTSLVAENAGVYTTMLSSEGTGEYFTFPIIIRENIQNAELAKTSWVEPQKAGFSLVREGEEKSFDWYVDFQKNIDTTKFKKGNTVSTETTKYEYTPVNGTTAYLHIKLDENVDYGYEYSTQEGETGVYFEATILVTVKDNAGNVSTKTFPICHQVDNIEPIGEIDSTVIHRVDYENLTSSFTNQFKVTDNLGIKEIQYYWTYTTTDADGTKTTIEDPSTIDLSNSFTKEYSADATLSIPFDAVEDYGRKGSAFLTITYKDFANYNGTIEGETYNFDFTKADAVYKVNGGTKTEPVFAPKLYLSEPASTSEGNRTIVLIPYGTTETGETKYYLYDPMNADDEVSYNETLDLIQDVYDCSYDNNYAISAPGYWYDVVGKIENGAGTFSSCNTILRSSHEAIKNYISGIYGTVEVYFVTSSAFETAYGSRYSFIEATSTIESATAYLANNTAYEVTITGVKDEESADALSKLNYVSGNVPAKNLDNVEISLSLQNTTSGEEVAGYGFQMLDFDNSKIELFYYGANTSYSGTMVCEWPLAEAASQSVIIPEGITTKTGWYGLQVTMKKTDGETITTKMQQYYFMDSCELDISLESYYKAYRNENNYPSVIVAESENKETWGENPSIEISLDTAPGEGWTLDTYFNFSKDTRNDADDYNINELVKLRVYNKNDANYEENAIWIEAADISSITYIPTYTEVIDAESYGTQENLLLPLYDGDNLICYELVNTNGVIKHYEVPVYAYAKSEEWELDVEYTEISERTGGIMEVVVQPIVSENIDLDHSTFNYVENRTYTPEKSYTFRDDFDCEFWLLDQNGNLSTKKYAVSDVDGNAPYFVGFTTGTAWDDDTEAYYHFQVYAYDFDGAISADELTLTFDADYSAVLMGLTGDARANNTDLITMKVPINREKDENGEYLPWESYEPGNNGIYRTKLLEEGPDEEWGYAGDIRVEIWGTWKYDAENDVSKYPNSGKRELTFTVLDENGNSQSGTRVYDGSERAYYNYDYDLTIAGFYENGEMIHDETGENLPLLDENGQIAIYSCVPFSKIYSYGASHMKEVTTEWPGNTYLYTTLPMIQEDGSYFIEFMDLFGDIYQREITVEEFGNVGVSVEFSETEYTNQEVTITATATLNNDFITSITAITDTDQEIEGTINSSDKTKATIILPENGKVIVKTNLGKERTIPVTNIDKVLEEASVSYVNSLGIELTGTENLLDEEVTALVECSESLEGIDGNLSFTFPRGSRKGDSHTFYYKDAAGNEGNITAVLPCDISELEREEDFVDTTAPTFTMGTYGMRNNKYYFITDLIAPNNIYLEDGEEPCTNEEFVALLTGEDGLASYISQSYKLILDIDDESETKLVVQKSGEAAPTSYEAVSTGSSADNVSVSGNAITISENAVFDLHIIDENNNVTSITGIDISSIDKEAPVFTVKYEVSEDKKTVYAIFVPEKPQDALTLIYPWGTNSQNMESKELESGVTDENGVPYMIERYFYTFTENGTNTFIYKDEYGNIGECEANVQGFSTGATKVTSVAWTGTTDKKDPSITSRKVNRDINANLNLSKAIRGVSLYLYDENAENKKGTLLTEDASIEVNSTSKNVSITYHENMPKVVVELITSDNDNITYYTMPEVGCIDKKVPVVTVEEGKAVLSEDKRSMTITFSADEPVVMSESGKSTFSQTHTWVVKDNKQRVLHFADEAGNITEYTITQNSEVDTLVLTAVYSATEEHGDETTNPAKDLKVQAGNNIWIKTNKAAEVAFGEEAKTSISANTWTKLVLPEIEGVYMIQLTDSNTQEVSHKTISVQVKDKISPEISFDSNAIVLSTETSVTEMMQKIHSGVSIVDNRDGKIDTFEVSGYPQTVEPGLYELTYLTSDKSGNKAIENRTLYIMEEGMTVLYINGIPALPFARTIIDGYDLNFAIQGFGDEDTITMKIRSGIKSLGQMKRYTTSIQNMHTTVSEGGFYTIYVRTQEREEYVAYIYLEE